MRERFKYEAPSALWKALTITAPRRWRSKARPWIFDTVSGVRVQLADEEEAVLSRLTAHLRKTPLSPHLHAAFDHVARAVMERRRGYCFEWTRLANRTPAEWDSWLGDHRP